ncbi:DUF6048 family protein [Bacteroides sp. 51]|uniref:DUF6048 family protein n=1 Tax=Bacteroides sp. 51 TaxID=2302938 RepID=UPI0013D8C9AC|nr:DUF6048 family protein [Bacteroides sp. 51]NDV80937.1 hypothetical protein [Bacteroides sp. 51]
MGQKTLNYTIVKAISLILFLVCTASIHAQNSTSDKDKKKEDIVEFPLYNGLTVSADIYGLGAKVFGSDFLSSEIAVEANLKNRFFPIVEIGYGTTDAWSERGTHYKSSAPYFRIGMNYNTMYKKGNPNFLYLGFRYGYTSFSYDAVSTPAEDPIFEGNMENPSLTDNIWGGSVAFDHKGLKASMGWLELVVGIRTKVYKDFYMGWSLRYKRSMNTSLNEYGDPWYVPGYGEYDSNRFGLTYSLIYKLPF